MTTQNTRIEAPTATDLQLLVTNQVAEGKIVEYKLELPGGSDDDKREFLSDVSSFANASGGFLYYGVQEHQGIAVQVPGVKVADIDAEKQRMESLLRTSIEPRIPGVTIEHVTLPSQTVVCVIRIPKSWALPHRVSFKGGAHFYSRNSAGKYQLDVAELRGLFTLSDTTTERIRDFRIERLSKIGSGATPLPMTEGEAKIVLHLIPIDAFDPARRLDLYLIANDPARIPPMQTMGWNHRYNFDGFLTYSGNGKDGISDCYTQVFRSGIIEAVTENLLGQDRDGRKYIASVAYEQTLIEAVATYLPIQRDLGAQTPIIASLALVGASGYVMSTNWEVLGRGHAIDRDVLVTPEVLIDDFSVDVARALKPAFDAIWNAAGYPGSRNYDQNGNWTERVRRTL